MSHRARRFGLLCVVVAFPVWGCLGRPLVVDGESGAESDEGGSTNQREDDDEGFEDEGDESDSFGSSEDSGVVECFDPEDCDEDGIPDRRDPMPRDPALPGQARSDVMYANTSSDLWVVDVDSLEPSFVASFTFDQQAGTVTDIAIGKFGVLYAVTGDAVFACEPNEARCFFLTAAEDLNAAGFVSSANGPDVDDTLYAAGAFGSWNRVNLNGATVSVERVGDYDGAISAGDIDGDQGLAAATIIRDGVQFLAVVQPETGEILDEFLPYPGFEAWGIVMLSQTLIGFSPDGNIEDVFRIGPFSQNPLSWWGAALHPANTR